jgi:3-oxoacyl-[acyl-carrier protein] reductase
MEKSNEETMTTENMKLTGRVAVVTGASKGIGAGIAKHLAAEGAAVVVNYAASKAAANNVVADIAKGGGKAIAVQADMSSKADVERLFGETRQTLGTLDILVNNAGIYEFAPLENVTEEHFHKQFKSQCPRPAPGHPGGREAIRACGRQRHQHQFNREYDARAERGRLQRD